ncbi:MAG: PKD domain-containing protein [Paludibacteraceae bacterium]|nr:PKD domain-containing protein [Paludibacteraceae bacterium]
MKTKTSYITLIALAIVALTACNKNSVDFTYSPTEPRAGEKVSFSNLSTSGEEWLWSFGDGSTATNKFPSHVYKQPGKYVVSLKVDNKPSLMKTREITIYDTIPNFSSTIVDSIGSHIYTNETFEALVYNPYSFAVSYEWSVEGVDYVGLSATNTGKTYQLYFSKQGTATVRLRIVMNGDTTLAEHTYVVNDVPARALLMQTADSTCYRQRLFDDRQEGVQAYPAGLALLRLAQDTMQTYNGKVFLLSELQAQGYPMKGFAIAYRKVYYRNDGLYVANLDGSHTVQIDTAEIAALCVDTEDNRLYWANTNGVWALPLIGTDNNQFTTQPIQMNNLQHVVRLTMDNEKH